MGLLSLHLSVCPCVVGQAASVCFSYSRSVLDYAHSDKGQNVRISGATQICVYDMPVRNAEQIKQ